MNKYTWVLSNPFLAQPQDRLSKIMYSNSDKLRHIVTCIFCFLKPESIINEIESNTLLRGGLRVMKQICKNIAYIFRLQH